MSRVVTLGPVGYNPIGEYDETYEYEKLNVVYYEGSSYEVLKRVNRIFLINEGRLRK